MTFVAIEPENDECVPTKAHETDSGYDLKAFLDEAVTLEPGERKLIPCGFRMKLPFGYEAQIRPRSGLALKNGVTVANAPGTVDQDYVGNIGVILYNFSKEPYTVFPYARIAQMVIASVVECKLFTGYVDKDTDRGVGGFGSTGQ